MVSGECLPQYGGCDFAWKIIGSPGRSHCGCRRGIDLLGAERVDAGGQSARLLPVITSLSGAGVVVSAETYNPEVAKKSLGPGQHHNLTGAGEAEAIYESVAMHSQR